MRKINAYFVWYFTKYIVKQPFLEFKSLVQDIYAFFKNIDFKSVSKYVNKMRFTYAVMFIAAVYFFIIKQEALTKIFLAFTIFVYLYKSYVGGKARHMFRKIEEEETKAVFKDEEKENP